MQWRFLKDAKARRAGGRVGRNMKRKSAPKMSGLVLAALRNLRDARGSSSREIMKYIMAEYNASEATVQRQLKTALKRGVDYGILKKTQNGYSLNTDAEVITPFDPTIQQADACKKKRPACPKKKKMKKCGMKKKRRSACKPKKPKRKSCKKKKKKPSCNVCSTRGGGRDPERGMPVRLLDNSAPSDDNSLADSDKSVDGEQDRQPQEQARARNNPARSRSASRARSRFSDEEDM